jgi:hypothetical protein
MIPSRDRIDRLVGSRRGLFSVLIGCALGILFHYMFYRLSLPVEPFIYVVF